MRQVSYDLSLAQPLALANGRHMTALEVQWEHLDLARKYSEDVGLAAIGGDDVGREILRRWEEVLSGLEAGPMDMANRLDWVAKYRAATGNGTGWVGGTRDCWPWTSNIMTSARSAPCTLGRGWNGCWRPRPWPGP